MTMKLKTAACFLLIVIQTSYVCFAGETVLRPRINAMLEYNDNLFFSRTDTLDDFVVKASPEFDLAYTSDKIYMKTGMLFDFYEYLDNSYLSDSYYTLDFQNRFSLTEKAGLSLDFIAEKSRSLDSDLAETGTITVFNDKRTGSLSLGYSYLFTDRLEVNINSSYAKIDYDSELHTDYKSQYFSATVYRKLANRVDTIIIQPYYSGFRTELSDVDSFGLYTGLSHLFNETLSVSLNIGARYTETSYFYIFKEDDWGGLANISVEKSGETWKSGLSLSRDLKFGSYGEAIETNQVKLNFEKNIYDDLKYSFRGSYTDSDSSGRFRDEETEYYNVTNSLEYRLNQDVTVGGSYTYASHYSDNWEVDEDADRNLIRINIKYVLKPMY